MANLVRNFIGGKMNKTYDQRVVPNGEYIDAMNVRMGSTENSEVGVIENTKGNIALTLLSYTDGTPLSFDALCIGAIADSAREKIYWFVHDPSFSNSPTGKLDLIVSFNVFTGILTYHIISTDDGMGTGNTTLNFNPKYLITGIDLIENLLFFTDDYNAPRFINITRNYANPIGYIDQFDPESILVIKRPPNNSPGVTPVLLAGQNNFMDERFICFAYRYRYVDGEYSATSQWSAPAFAPNEFEFSINSYLNQGMTNRFNAALVTYNSGGPLVVGIDLLFKQAGNNIIKIIEKLDKDNLGLADNTEYTYTFSNSKIFTVLSESELLRLYDNVPRFAKAQTIMGNRLMYGNYVEGYDLIDNLNVPIKLEYTTDLVSQVIGQVDIPTSTSYGIYSMDTAIPPINIANSSVIMELGGLNLVAGASISLDVTLTHSQFTGNAFPLPTETTQNVDLNLTIFLQQNYNSVWEFIISPQLGQSVGDATNIQTVPDSCNGVTLTDNQNCLVANTLNTFVKTISGIDYAISNSIGIYNGGTTGTFLQLQFVAMRYEDTVDPTKYVIEYYKITSAEAKFQELGTPRSLHSNRDYEIGIVYMDDFKRSTTALVSPNNTEHVPCKYAERQNQIYVTIPPEQRPPYWAKSYKFVIKPDQENYETIYSSIFFSNPLNSEVYFYLEGENTRKVETGDRLIVKADSLGPTQTCAYATVLEKEAKQAGFIEPVSGAVPPAGVYMKINPNDFSAIDDPSSNVLLGQLTTNENNGGHYVLQQYLVSIPDPATPGMYLDYTIPAGSRIKLSIKFQRLGTGSGGNKCEKRIYTLDKTLTANANYDNFKDWWDGDNVQDILNSGVQEVGGGNCDIDNQYISTLATSGTDIPENLCINYYRFYREPANNGLYLLLRGTKSCEGPFSNAKRRSTIITDIQITRANNIFIFETEPSDSLPDVFFENDLSLEIIDGNHMGNIQDQDVTGGIPAIINTGFFNCFSFGNGAESYKIRDSLIGRPFNLGNRVTTVSAQDYKESDRFADITYSGVYNTESNLNKLNEFNLGLLDYKYLEASFGDIYVLDGRETDVLVLQEDKISYVLAGKNLLSDSAAGGAITSVPEVLGTQIARTEKYGISFNPESYVQWGYDRFFTDAKRGAVIQLVGNSYSNEEIKIISEANMRTWFRDSFNNSFATQKLGAFDPYMNEYVLSFTDRELPTNPSCLDCGVSQTFTLSSQDNEQKSFIYCVNVGQLVGNVDVGFNVISIESGATFNVKVTFNGNTYESGFIDYSYAVSFYKDVNYVETMQIEIVYDGAVVLDMTPSCPFAETMKVVSIVLSRDSDSGNTIHAENRYTIGSFVGPLQSNFVILASGTTNPLVSFYNIVSGYTGGGAFPPSGSTMRIQSNKFIYDSKDFDATKDKFLYYRTSTLYENNSVDMNQLLSEATVASPVMGGGSIYYADFIVPSAISGEYLYLIWDFRTPNVVELCYNGENGQDACCNCTTCPEGTCKFVKVTALQDSEVYFPSGICGETEGYTLTLVKDAADRICLNSYADYQIIYGNVHFEINQCDCH